MAPLKKGEKVFVTHSDGKEYGAKVIDTKPKTVKIHCESAGQRSSHQRLLPDEF